MTLSGGGAYPACTGLASILATHTLSYVIPLYAILRVVRIMVVDSGMTVAGELDRVLRALRRTRPLLQPGGSLLQTLTCTALDTLLRNPEVPPVSSRLPGIRISPAGVNLYQKRYW